MVNANYSDSMRLPTIAFSGAPRSGPPFEPDRGMSDAVEQVVFMRSLSRSQSGTSLLEVIIAISILAFALTAIYTTYTASLNQINLGTSSQIAGENLIQRMDALRSTNFANAVSPTYITTLLSTAPTSTSTGLASITSETITITPVAIPNLAPNTAVAGTAASIFFSVKRTGTSTPVTTWTGTPASLSGQQAVTVRINITWLDRRNRTRQRELCTVLSSASFNP